MDKELHVFESTIMVQLVDLHVFGNCYFTIPQINAFNFASTYDESVGECICDFCHDNIQSLSSPQNNSVDDFLPAL